MLKGKVAVVTGGTRGIGFGVVKLFLDNGAKVALCGSRQATVDKALAELKAINPDYEVMGYAPDLLDMQAVREMLNDVVAQWGKLDIMVNNAGVSNATPLLSQADDEFAKVMNLNVQAVYNCCKEAAALMKPNHSGVILNTSSMVSLYGQPSGCGYPTSKFAVNGLTKSLARELGKDGIRVNAVAPGVIATDMVAALGEDMAQRLMSTIPLGRFGQPEDIANAFLYLASDMASYVTGAILSVDGAAMT